MKLYYIREEEKTYKIKKKIGITIKRLFNIIRIKKEDDKTICFLPVLANRQISNYRIRKLSKKIIKVLYNNSNNSVENIVLSKYLYNLEPFKQELYSNNINILDGRFLFRLLSFEIIKYICKIKNKEIYDAEVVLLINDLDKINIELIKLISKNIRSLNIVTKNIHKFDRIKKYLYDEYGVVINISNNKKYSLFRAEIIINIDFTEELINEYRINDKAIIINILKKIKIYSKRFDGINISYYRINIPKEYKIKGYKAEIIYESTIYNKSFESILNRVNEDKITISKLIGNNGYINKMEIKRK